MPSWLAIVCAFLAVRLLALEALAERAKRAGAVRLYRAPVVLRVLFGTAIVAMVYGAGVVVLSEGFPRDWWVSVLLLGIAAFCAWQWPAEIGVSKSGIFGRKWLGLHKRVFEWKDIASAALNPVEDSIARASLRKELHPGYEIPSLYEYRDVTPLSWGERFHFKKLVSRPAMELIIQRGGRL